jgi:hypothetical protein
VGHSLDARPGATVQAPTSAEPTVARARHLPSRVRDKGIERIGVLLQSNAAGNAAQGTFDVIPAGESRRNCEIAC